jgi:excisionase family DNA binding protein
MESAKTNNDVPDILTVEEAAEYLKVSPQMIRKMVKENRIAFFRVGNRTRIIRDDFIESLRKLENEKRNL